MYTLAEIDFRHSRLKIFQITVFVRQNLHLPPTSRSGGVFTVTKHVKLLHVAILAIHIQGKKLVGTIVQAYGLVARRDRSRTLMALLVENLYVTHASGSCAVQTTLHHHLVAYELLFKMSMVSAHACLSSITCSSKVKSISLQLLRLT